MQVKLSYDKHGETSLEFLEPIVADAENIRPHFSVHGHIRDITGDRVAVAVVLLLGSAVSDALRVGRPVSKRVATQIRRYLDDESLEFPDAAPVTAAVHSGSVEIVVAAGDLESLPTPSQKDRRRISFLELPTHRSSGRLFTFDKIVVSSNSWIFAGEPGSSSTKLSAALAVPVLMAQDLSASKIDVPQSMISGSPQSEVQNLANLLAVTDIVFSVDGNIVHAK